MLLDGQMEWLYLVLYTVLFYRKHDLPADP